MYLHLADVEESQDNVLKREGINFQMKIVCPHHIIVNVTRIIQEVIAQARQNCAPKVLEQAQENATAIKRNFYLLTEALKKIQERLDSIDKKMIGKEQQ